MRTLLLMAAIAVALGGCATSYPNTGYDRNLAATVGAELRR